MDDDGDHGWNSPTDLGPVFRPAPVFSLPGQSPLLDIIKSLNDNDADRVLLSNIIDKISADELRALNKYIAPPIGRRGRKKLMESGKITQEMLREWEIRGLVEPKQLVKLDIARKRLDQIRLETGRNFQDGEVDQLAKEIERKGVKLPDVRKGRKPT